VSKAITHRFWNIPAVLGILIILGLYFTSLYSYLLFHSITEIISIIVACGIFIIAWNSKKFLDNKFLLFIGVAYLFIGGLDLLHTLAYKGMGVFQGYDANLPTQLWIAARYLQSISLFIAPLFLSRRWINVDYIFLVYSFVTALVLMTIFWNIFPVCYLEGIGLTTFKRVSEYVICLILIGAIIALFRVRNEFDEGVFWLLVVAIVLTIGAELAFTFYISVYGFSNLVGHYLKLISFFLIYKALIETALVKPYNLIFRRTSDLLSGRLKKCKEELRLQRDNLDKALAENKDIKAMLPICSDCKKVWDDKEFYKKLEKYIQEYPDTKFFYNICPECAKKQSSDSENKINKNSNEA
jgi:membrane-associated sensor protein